MVLRPMMYDSGKQAGRRLRLLAALGARRCTYTSHGRRGQLRCWPASQDGSLGTGPDFRKRRWRTGGAKGGEAGRLRLRRHPLQQGCMCACWWREVGRTLVVQMVGGCRQVNRVSGVRPMGCGGLT